MSIYAGITVINKKENYICYEDELELQVTSKSEAYKILKEYYGKCTGKIYIDTKNKDNQGYTSKEIGYTFEKKEDWVTYQYWITLYTNKYMVYEYLK